MPTASDIGALVAFVGGLGISAVGGLLTVAWFASGHVAMLQDYGRRIGVVEAQLKASASSVSAVDARLARIETALSFIVAQLGGRSAPNPDLFTGHAAQPPA